MSSSVRPINLASAISCGVKPGRQALLITHHIADRDGNIRFVLIVKYLHEGIQFIGVRQQRRAHLLFVIQLGIGLLCGPGEIFGH